MRDLITFYTLSRLESCVEEPYLHSKKIPEWFKNTNKEGNSKCPWLKFKNIIFDRPEKRNSVRTCPGIIDNLSTGYIIPSWNNFLVRGDKEHGLIFDWEKTDDKTSYVFHDVKSQCSGMNEKESPMYRGFHKFDSPWYVKTSPGYSLYITHPYWSREKRFTTVSGIVHPDKVPLPIKWFFEWNIEYKSIDEYDSNHFVKKGDPLLLVIPFKRTKVKSEVKYIDDSFFDRMASRSLHYSQDWMNKSAYSKFRKSIGNLFN